MRKKQWQKLIPVPSMFYKIKLFFKNLRYFDKAYLYILRYKAFSVVGTNEGVRRRTNEGLRHSYREWERISSQTLNNFYNLSVKV